MPQEHEIKSEKILVKKIFSDMWFRIPDYQRPYIWGKDQVNDLLDDLNFAQKNKPNQEYFLGSFVYQSKRAGSVVGQQFDENDLLDGQQRMTTMLMLFACIRDLADEPKVTASCTKAIFQEGDDIDEIPERTRIVFAIREAVQDFVNEYIKKAGGTAQEEELEALIHSSEDPSVPNMVKAIQEIRRYLSDPENSILLKDFLMFLRNKVLLIYVSTEDLDDAFRLFMILNDRGVPLRNSDILKSQNLGALECEQDSERLKRRYAELWEKAEGELGDEFDRFLNYLRTVLVKEKARLNLLDEYDQKIYNPKEKDKKTGQLKPALLTKGKATFEMVERYLKHYGTLINGVNVTQVGGNFRFDNLIKIMWVGLPSTDWIPPLLRYFDRFKYNGILEFLTLLDNKFSSDWVSQYTPTARIENMNEVIRVVESCATPEEVLQSACFDVDQDAFVRSIESAVYGRRFTRYLLLKLDYIYHNESQKLSVDRLSVEHILPQTPEDTSQWKQDFTDKQREEWTHRLGNLVLITTNKNASQGRKDYANKKKDYFLKRIDTCPNSLRVLNQNDQWTPVQLEANHREVLGKLREHYGIALPVATES
ncbi:MULTISPECIES: DUF262 domain-containing protein [unclassified Lentimonas]|uniref:DUF262 domain-containing protein n=1 Tax=unclassified Lentimonas TaxID=2630993 RepID=UPI0013268A47|nr:MULTISPECIES: DUF262 domain-containing protein [unclassified Lentimonas]CAA6677377.1 Unannotated [Lentimonas sp. CC4]CAA6686922.1 Unannotated [Lentimonas sp. CC6]CAA6690105.1 Unannotated [Lentimonas sp. CC19]CAA6690933.1 Unannotated [Lentimonas sp. CC10]CAA7070715.1 Unannotated [Lentimonas sp. CC11]